MGVVLRAIGGLLGLLPVGWVRALGRGLGWVWHDVVPIRRGTARRNVIRALPELSRAEAHQIVRVAFRSYGQFVLEMLRGVDSPAGFEAGHHLAEALAKGRGVVVVTAHLGNFERLVALSETFGAPVHVVTRRFRSPTAQQNWRRLRAGGARLLEAGRSGRAAVAALRAGGIVGYVLDQHDAGRRALWLPFFGIPAATSPDAARLARLTGAALVPMFTWWDGARHRVWVEPAVEPGPDDAETTRRCLARVEAAVRAHPEQWLWIHRRWKTPPDAQAPR